MHKVQFKVKPVTRYIVTEYHSYSDDSSGNTSSSLCGEFQNAQLANQACQALAHSCMSCEMEDSIKIEYKLFSHEYDQDDLDWVSVENPQ